MLRHGHCSYRSKKSCCRIEPDNVEHAGPNPGDEVSTPTFYRPCALLAKAALVGAAGRRFENVVVENDHGTVVLSGIVARAQLVSEAEDLAANAAGTLVLNRVIVGR